MKRELLIANLKREDNALEEKYHKLTAALTDKESAKEISETQRELLIDQASVMRLYMRILLKRIEDLESKDCGKGKEPKMEETCKEKDSSTSKDKDENEESDAETLAKKIAYIIGKAIEEDRNSDYLEKAIKHDYMPYPFYAWAVYA